MRYDVVVGHIERGTGLVLGPKRKFSRTRTVTLIIVEGWKSVLEGKPTNQEISCI